MPDPNDQSILDAAESELAAAEESLAWELSKAAVDVAGIVDPTPISDAVGMAMSLKDGDVLGAGLSLLSMVPYAGDALGKTAKGARAAKKINDLRKKVAALVAKVAKLKKGKKGAEAAKDAVSKAKKAVDGPPDPCTSCAKGADGGKPKPGKAARAKSLSNMEDAAKNGDVSTPEDGLVLWSGGGPDGAGKAAKDLAAKRTSEGFPSMTLEDTPAGKIMEAESNILGDLSAAERAATGNAWTTVSERLAGQAVGDVTVVVDPGKLRPGAVIFDEVSTLAGNANVTGVTVLDTAGNTLSTGSPASAEAALLGLFK